MTTSFPQVVVATGGGGGGSAVVVEEHGGHDHHHGHHHHHDGVRSGFGFGFFRNDTSHALSDHNPQTTIPLIHRLLVELALYLKKKDDE